MTNYGHGLPRTRNELRDWCLRELGDPVLEINVDEDQVEEKCKGYLSQEDANKAARIKTEIKNLSHDQFVLLFRQGFEVADYTLHAYESSAYDLIGYDSDGWSKHFK